MKAAATAHPSDFLESPSSNAAHQAYQILHCAFVVAPVLAGLDKFFNELTEWTMYLWAPLGRLTGGAATFMHIAGVIEIFVGALVAFKPKLGAPLLSAWFLGIVLNLILVGNYYDIALRDFGRFLAALALSRLSVIYAAPLNDKWH